MSQSDSKKLRTLASYSTEILKIKKTLFPDDSSIRASVVQQIEFILDLIEQFRHDESIKGYQFYNVTDHICVITVGSGESFHSISYNRCNKEIVTPTYRSSDSGTESNLMETYAILSDLYLNLLERPEVGPRVESWKNRK